MKTYAEKLIDLIENRLEPYYIRGVKNLTLLIPERIIKIIEADPRTGPIVIPNEMISGKMKTYFNSAFGLYPIKVIKEE